MIKNNKDIREQIKKAGIRQWVLAEKLGFSEFYFSRILRKELSEERKKTVCQAIEELKAEHMNNV